MAPNGTLYEARERAENITCKNGLGSCGQPLTCIKFVFRFAGTHEFIRQGSVVKAFQVLGDEEGADEPHREDGDVAS